MRRKLIMCMLFLAMVVIFLTGCSSVSSRLPAGSTNVDDVLKKRAAEDSGESATGEVEKSKITESNGKNAEISEEDAAKMAGDIDYDLTLMSSDMVYATVYQFMVNPSAYVGKTVRMRGMYYNTYLSYTAKDYHFVLIQDAMSCCGQGMEFVWGDGKRVYPDEYPPGETEVEVTGIFEIYKEEEDENRYCRLRNSTLSVVES